MCKKPRQSFYFFPFYDLEQGTEMYSIVYFNEWMGFNFGEKCGNVSLNSKSKMGKR
jgi:hypothetical protein